MKGTFLVWVDTEGGTEGDTEGGYMTLMQFAVIFWHDLAAPVIAGVLVSLIVSHWRSRK